MNSKLLSRTKTRTLFWKQYQGGYPKQNTAWIVFPNACHSEYYTNSCSLNPECEKFGPPEAAIFVSCTNLDSSPQDLNTMTLAAIASRVSQANQSE